MMVKHLLILSLSLKVIYKKLRKFIKRKIFGLTNLEKQIISFQNSINPEMQRISENIIHKTDELLTHADSYVRITESSININSTNNQEILESVSKYYFKRYKHLSHFKILIHLPSPEGSMAGYSAFKNLIEALNYIGINSVPLKWNDNTESLFDIYKPNILITSDNSAYLKKIDWNYVAKYRKSNKLLVGLSASLADYGNSPLINRLKWAKKHSVSFYYSFRAPEYLSTRKDYLPFYDYGYKIYPIEFGANIIRYFPSFKNVKKELEFAFLGSLNRPKWTRYIEYFSKIFTNHIGFINGPGWKLFDYTINLDRDKYIYWMSKVGLNLHIDSQLEWPTELNERTYLLAACGIPQLIDNPKLLKERFNLEGFFIADSAKEYYDKFLYILSNPEEAVRRSNIAFKDVMANYTTFHRAEQFVTNLCSEFEM